MDSSSNLTQDFSKDILQEIPDQDLAKLRDFYKGHKIAPWVYSFINTAIKWKQKDPKKDYLTFYAPLGDWKTDGTFIIFMHFYCYDLFVFTKEESCNRLYEALVRTERFEFKTKRILFSAIHRIHVPKVLEAINVVGVPILHVNECMVWWMPKEEAVKITYDIPDEVYIKKLDKSHIPVINEVWPHKYSNSHKFLGVLLEMGSGYGVFLKEDDTLASWVFKNQMGTLGILQTVEEHKRKGYASLILKVMSKEIGEDGHDPLGTVLVKNRASQVMFMKLGFKELDKVTFVEGQDYF